MNAVGIHIRKLRKQHSLSQQALAEQLNVTRQAVSQWENGNTQPDLDMLERVAKAFGVDILEVIYGEKRKTSAIDPKRRKRYLTGLIVFGALALILEVIIVVVKPCLVDWFYQHYDYRPSLIFNSIAGPLFHMSLALAALNGSSLIWNIRICQHRARKIVFCASVVFVALYSIIIPTPFIIQASGWGFSLFIFNSMLYLIQHPVVFLLPGIGLFLGLNGRGTEPKPVDTAMRE